MLSNLQSLCLPINLKKKFKQLLALNDKILTGIQSKE